MSSKFGQLYNYISKSWINKSDDSRSLKLFKSYITSLLNTCLDLDVILTVDSRLSYCEVHHQRWCGGNSAGGTKGGTRRQHGINTTNHRVQQFLQTFHNHPVHSWRYFSKDKHTALNTEHVHIYRISPWCHSCLLIHPESLKV